MKIFSENGMTGDRRMGVGSIPADFAVVVDSPPMNSGPYRIIPAGSSTFRMLQSLAAQHPDETFYLTSLVKDPRPGGKSPTMKEVRKDLPITMEELARVKPTRILAIGTYSAKALCPGFSKLRDDHGSLFFNPALGCVVVPTFSPSTVYNDPYNKEFMARDLERFFALPDPVSPRYQIFSGDMIQKAIANLDPAKPLILDVETTGLDPRTDSITMLGMRSLGEEPMLMTEPPKRWQLKVLLDWIRESGVMVIGHNLQFDLSFLSYQTRELWTDLPVYDTMMGAHISGEPVLSLKHLTTLHTDRPGPRSMGGHEDAAYLAEDLYSTEELYHHYAAGSSFSTQLMNGFIPVTVGSRINGVYLDFQSLFNVLSSLEVDVKAADKELQSFGAHGVNLNSPAQVATFLIEAGVPLTERTATGKYSTAEPILVEHADHPAVAALLKYRESVKVLEFVQSYNTLASPEHPYLHPTMKPTGTVTGRISMSDPNLQQVPRVGPVKTLFVSRYLNGWIGLLDLDQAELRIAAILAGDRAFGQLMQGDPHTSVARIVYRIPEGEEVDPTLRKRSKGITFGLLYGGSPGGLAKRVGCDVAEVNTVLEVMFQQFPGLMGLLDKLGKWAISSLSIRLPFGRVRDLRKDAAIEGQWAVERKGINTPIQGTAGEIPLLIMQWISKAFREQGLVSKVLFGVHDSILFDIHPNEREIVAEICQTSFEALHSTPLEGFELFGDGTVPLTGELILGASWAAIESTNEHYNPEHKYLISSTPIDDEEWS